MLSSYSHVLLNGSREVFDLAVKIIRESGREVFFPDLFATQAGMEYAKTTDFYKKICGESEQHDDRMLETFFANGQFDILRRTTQTIIKSNFPGGMEILSKILENIKKQKKVNGHILSCLVLDDSMSYANTSDYFFELINEFLSNGYIQIGEINGLYYACNDVILEGCWLLENPNPKAFELCKMRFGPDILSKIDKLGRFDNPAVIEFLLENQDKINIIRPRLYANPKLFTRQITNRYIHKVGEILENQNI